MTGQEQELPVVRKLLHEVVLDPSSGLACLVNPDGPEAAELIKELVEAAQPFADTIVIDPTKKPGERHWATVGKLTDMDDVLKLQTVLTKARASGGEK